MELPKSHRCRILGAMLMLAMCIAHVSSKDLPVDGQAVVDQLTKLATYTDDPNPAVTRILFTENDMHGRRYIKQLMADAGLKIREDSVGNIFGRWEGSDPTAGAVLTGSHCDAIPLAGMYDGTLGVVGAIAALDALNKAGFQPKRSLEVLMFTSEEPTRFGLSCVGSRAMAGVLTAPALAALRDANGSTFLQAAASAGYGGSSQEEEVLAAARVQPGAYDYFVELHIEQGPLLEQRGFDIGVVHAIAAPAALELSFQGDGGHAGALLMPYRNDAALAAAEVALAAERAALSSESPYDTVATTGFWDIKPGAINSVPRDVRIGIDVRDIDGPRRDKVVDAIIQAAKEVSERRKVRHAVSILSQDPPAYSSTHITAVIEEAVKQLKLKHSAMVSRAYHDSLFMARICPTAMIFIPCRNGWSHRPDEYAHPSAIAAGVRVLALTMAELSGGAWGDQPPTAAGSPTHQDEL